MKYVVRKSLKKCGLGLAGGKAVYLIHIYAINGIIEDYHKLIQING